MKILLLSIIILPNNSEKELRKNAHKGYIFIESGTNKGYAAGNNIGLKYAYEHGYDYAWILNNDILIDDNLLLKKMIEVFEKDDFIAVVNPDIYSPEWLCLIEILKNLHYLIIQ